MKHMLLEQLRFHRINLRNRFLKQLCYSTAHSYLRLLHFLTQKRGGTDKQARGRGGSSDLSFYFYGLKFFSAVISNS